MTKMYLENTVRPKLQRLLARMNRSREYDVSGIGWSHEDVEFWLDLIEEGRMDGDYWQDNMQIANAIWRQL